MPNNLVKIDEYDKKLLYELDKDAHTTISALTKKLKKSKQFIDYRIKRLEEEKIILAYQAIIDSSKLGFITYRIYIKFQQMTKEDEFIEFLKNYENIWTIARLHGKWDFAFFIGVKNIRELHETWDKLTLKFKSKIKEYDIAVYAPIINHNRTFFTDKKLDKIDRIYGDGNKLEYDEIDLKIIKEYSTNVRTAYIDIAKKLDLSINTIINRIKILEKKKIICGYKLDINLEPLGYEGYRVDLHLNSKEKIRSLREYCKQSRNIYQIMDTIGGADFEMSVIVKDFYDLLRLMKDMQMKFPEIDYYEYFGYSLFARLSYVPD